MINAVLSGESGVFHDVIAGDMHAHAVVKLGAECAADATASKDRDFSAADFDAGCGFPITGCGSGVGVMHLASKGSDHPDGVLGHGIV